MTPRVIWSVRYGIFGQSFMLLPNLRWVDLNAKIVRESKEAAK